MIYRLYNYTDQPPALTVYRLGFSGHRTLRTGGWGRCDTGLLSRLARVYAGAAWVHGGAEGFDRQVDEYAVEHGMEVERIRPNYAAYPDRPKYAPIARNYQIVDSVDAMVFLWDGRESGGTWDCLKYAKRKGEDFPIILLRPL